jgi:P27 family predicted phage terminase small subunit
MGRFRTPAALADLRGNPSKRRLPDQPQPDRGASCPSPPSWLGVHGREEWARLGPELHRRGLLTTADESTFAVYCQAAHHWVTAEKLARERGEATDDAEERLLRQIARAAAAQMAKIAGQFGMTPVARARIGAGIGGHGPDGDGGDGKFSGLLRGA